MSKLQSTIVGYTNSELKLTNSDRQKNHLPKKPIFSEAVGYIATLYRLNGVNTIIIGESAAAIYAHNDSLTGIIHIYILSQKEKCMLIAESIGFRYYGIERTTMLFRHTDWGYTLLLDCTPNDYLFMEQKYSIIRINKYLIWVQAVERVLIRQLEQWDDFSQTHDMKQAALICFYNEVNINEIFLWAKRNRRENLYDNFIRTLEQISIDINRYR